MSNTTKCTESERAIIKALHNTQIWTNSIYIIASIYAIFIGQWLLGIFGIVVAIISMLHHSYNYIDAKCIMVSNHTKHTILSDTDVIFANLLGIYGIYKIYIHDRPLSYTFIGLFTVCAIFALILFYISSYVYEPKAEKENINSQVYIKNAALYEHYHGYWHIMSGACYILTVLWLSL